MNDGRKFFLSIQNPLLPGALVKAEGWHSWMTKVHGNEGWQRCHLCGRREDFIFNFVRLTPVWDGEGVVQECRWHGPKSLWDVRTGLEVDIPGPPRWPRVRRLAEGVVLRVAIAVRFCWFLLVGVFWRLVASNVVTFGLVCGGIEKWRGRTQNDSF